VKKINSVRGLMVAGLFALSLPGLSFAPRAFAAQGCRSMQVPVSIAGDLHPYTIAGTFCRPAAATATVLLLVPGATYDRRYWDWPIRPDTYSFVAAMAGTGFATLAIDRLGEGGSSHPPATEVTIPSSATAIHQVVTWLRQVEGIKRVVLVGHSLGSDMSVIEAGMYKDVDGLVVSGYLHTFSPAAAALNTAFYPTQDDSEWQGAHLPPGYITTRPGARSLFYYSPNMDADIAAYDEAHKAVGTVGEFANFIPLFEHNQSARIRVPVLAVVGEDDAVFCSNVSCPQASIESGFYGPAAHFQLVVVPDAGHDLNLQRNAQVWYTICRHWLTALPA